MLINRKCCTHLLVTLDVDPSHPKAAVNDSMALAWATDAPQACHTQSVAQRVTQKCIADTCAHFQKDIDCINPTSCQSATLVFNWTTLPTNALHVRKQTERLLWHQLLECPCDEHPHNAGQAIKGVPKFKSRMSIFDACPTCVQAEQTEAQQQRPSVG